MLFEGFILVTSGEVLHPFVPFNC